MLHPPWDPGAAQQAAVWLYGAPALCTEAPQPSDGPGNAAGPSQAAFAGISLPCSVRRDLTLIFIFSLTYPASPTPTLLLSHD